jgi:AraC-like DNA-binding protein
LYKNFGHAEILGPFDKIGIVFQPLGLNHFVSGNLSTLASDEVNVNFSHFQRSLPTILDLVFDQKDIDAKVELLDAYFLQHLVEFEDKRLPSVVDFLFRTEDKLSVQQICENFDINRKTLLRLFNRHLNCSPKEYITLVQFRRAVELYQNSSHKPSLTRLALDLDYYDQSDFIHRFTKITGVSPKRLFTNIEKYGVHATYWTKD